MFYNSNQHTTSLIKGQLKKMENSVFNVVGSGIFEDILGGKDRSSTDEEFRNTNPVWKHHWRAYATHVLVIVSYHAKESAD